MALATEAFQQMHASDHPDYQSAAGLGLSIVSRPMALHDGTVAIDSETGVDTSVSLRFPPSRPAAIRLLVSRRWRPASLSQPG